MKRYFSTHCKGHVRMSLCSWPVPLETRRGYGMDGVHGWVAAANQIIASIRLDKRDRRDKPAPLAHKASHARPATQTASCAEHPHRPASRPASLPSANHPAPAAGRHPRPTADQIT